MDSCALLDVITGDEQWADWSANQIAATIDACRVVINPLIYAEVSVGYETIEEREELLPASAAIAGYRLLTRDVRRCRTYFPTIDIIAPTPSEGGTAG